jgi:hypothetical protein
LKDEKAADVATAGTNLEQTWNKLNTSGVCVAAGTNWNKTWNVWNKRHF